MDKNKKKNNFSNFSKWIFDAICFAKMISNNLLDNKRTSALSLDKPMLWLLSKKTP